MKKSATVLLSEKIEGMKRDFIEVDLLCAKALLEKQTEESLWKVQDVMKYLNCSKSVVVHAYLSGKIPYKQTLGGIRFDPEVVRNHTTN